MCSMSKSQQKSQALSQTNTGTKFLETYNPKKLAVIFKHATSPAACIDSGAVSLYGLRRDVGETKLQALIKLYLIDLNALLNLKRPLSEQMIDAIAEEIVSQFGYLNMADINLVFRRAKTGHYGELYETINMPKVIGWFTDYFNERCAVAAERSVQEAEQYKIDTDRVSDAMADADKAFKLKYMKYLNEQ